MVEIFVEGRNFCVPERQTGVRRYVHVKIRSVFKFTCKSIRYIPYIFQSMYIMFYMRLQISFPRKLKVENASHNWLKSNMKRHSNFQLCICIFTKYLWTVSTKKVHTLTSLINGHTRLFFSGKKSSLLLQLFFYLCTYLGFFLYVCNYL